MFVPQESHGDSLQWSETRDPQRTQSRAISLQREALRREGRLKRRYGRGRRVSELPAPDPYGYVQPEFKTPVAKKPVSCSKEQVYHSYRRLCHKHDGGTETRRFRAQLEAFAMCQFRVGDIIATYSDRNYGLYRERDRVIELSLLLRDTGDGCWSTLRVLFAKDLVKCGEAVIFHERTSGKLGVDPRHSEWRSHSDRRDGEAVRVGWVSRRVLKHVLARVDEENALAQQRRSEDLAAHDE